MKDNDLIWEIFRKEVVEAAGCTETSSVGLACAAAMHFLGKEKRKYIKVKEATITLDPATKKNGSGVGIAGTSEKGFHFAAALGIICGEFEKQLMAIAIVDGDSVLKAKKMIDGRIIKIDENKRWKGFRIRAEILSDAGKAVVVIRESHTNIDYIEINGKRIKMRKKKTVSELRNKGDSYKDILIQKNIFDLVQLAKNADASILQYVKQGIEVNLRLSENGYALSSVAQNYQMMINHGICSDDMLTRTKIRVVSGVQGRMKGIKYPAYSSGGSGNQGNVAILVPYLIGMEMNIDEDVVLRSIVLSHLLNAYVKCHTGPLSSMCGCSIAAGVGAAAAIVYQRDCGNVSAIEAAINNVISGTGGLLCDGGSEGCAAKVALAVEAVIGSAFAAIYGLNAYSNIVVSDSRISIINMANIAKDGMGGVDRQVNEIIAKNEA